MSRDFLSCFLGEYVAQVDETLRTLPLARIHDVVGRLHVARLRQQTIFIMGNGGSASTATHFAADLAKNTRQPDWPPFRVISLADNMAAVTAYANDEGYDRVFVNQLANLVKPDDVVIAISASGNSPNVLRAIEYANQIGATTVGFTGFDGGQLAGLVHYNLHVASTIIEQVEDLHLMFEHMMVKALRDHAAEVHALVGAPGLPALPEVSSSARSVQELLAAFSRDLGDARRPQDLLRRALQMALETLGAISGSIVVIDGQGQVIEGALAYGGRVGPPDATSLAEVLDDGLAGWVLNHHQPALVESTHDDPRWFERDWEAGAGAPRSAVSVPLMERDRVLGVLTLVHSRPGQFTQEHLALLTTLAILVSLAALRLVEPEAPPAA
jgi:D-sedoheptulose 7-phosphate isomerase